MNNDEPISRARQENRRIEVNEAWALRYWTQELRVTERDLRDAVDVVGPMLVDVKKILSRN